MKWFKHMTNMRHDVRMRRLVKKFGISGYGIYNAIIESIVETLDTENPIPDLEDNSQDMAEYFKMDTIEVEEIILFCLHQKLFDQDEISGRIICQKVYKFIEASQTRSTEIRQMIANYKQNHERLDLSQTVRDKSEEQNRTEQKRIEKKNISTSHFKKPTIDELKAYLEEKQITAIDPWHFWNYYEARGWMLKKTKMKSWKAAVNTWVKNSKNFGSKKAMYSEVVDARCDLV